MSERSGDGVGVRRVTSFYDRWNPFLSLHSCSETERGVVVRVMSFRVLVLPEVPGSDTDHGCLTWRSEWNRSPPRDIEVRNLKTPSELETRRRDHPTEIVGTLNLSTVVVSPESPDPESRTRPRGDPKIEHTRGVTGIVGTRRLVCSLQDWS